MDERVIRAINLAKDLSQLKAVEQNISAKGLLTDDASTLIRKRYVELDRNPVLKTIAVDTDALTPAERKIVDLVCEYISLQRKKGKNASRTIQQIKNRGLIGAAEEAVSHREPTDGFLNLAETNKIDLSYESIVVEHPEEFSARAIWFARRTLGLPNEQASPPAKSASSTQVKTEAMIERLRRRARAGQGRLDPFTNAELAAEIGYADLQSSGRAYGNIQSRVDFACYRLGLPPIGLVAAKPFDGAWQQEDRVWAYPVGSMQRAARAVRWTDDVFDRLRTEAAGLRPQAYQSWREEMARNEPGVRRWAFGFSSPMATTQSPPVDTITADLPTSGSPPPSTARDKPAVAGDGCYWVFVCNPRKWAIDRFLESGEEFDTWGVRPSDRDRFAPGQLAVVRVGIDHRSKAELAGREPLAAGIYALCEVVSPVFNGTGATDIYWADGEGRDPGWPTVRIRYLRRYLNAPLTIERLKREAPTLSPLLLNGHQASTFPLSKADFDRLMTMLGEDFEDIAPHGDHGVGDIETLRSIEEKYRNAAPEIREVVSRTIERGPIGRLAKKANGFKCQMCEALGDNPTGFLKSNGEPYVEAHHVVPVSKRQVGSLDASNVMTLCANHHRQIHHGRVEVTEDDGHFHVTVDGRPCTIKRTRLVDATPGE